MGFRGIDVREAGDRLLFRAYLQDGLGAKVASGTATLRLYELQSDGTLKGYDFNDHTFKTTNLTTPTVNLTHRTSDNGTYNTGLWTYALTTVSGFTAGNIYFAEFVHASASPPEQMQEFQYGSGVLADLADIAMPELTGDPGATPTIKQALMLRYMAERNAGTSSDTARTVKNDAGVTILTAPVSDDGAIFDQGKLTNP
jgi:hypothetical protein